MIYNTYHCSSKGVACRALAGLVFSLLLCFGPPSDARALEASGTRSSDVKVRIGILHMAPKLGQLADNVRALETLAARAFREGADIVVAPELATTGYVITPDQVRAGLGLRAPFDALASLRQLAMRNRGYLVVGIAEIGTNEAIYNSAVLFTPQGDYHVQRKRGQTGPGWTRGDTPFIVVPTPFGDLGMVICSDTYLMDWSRILALQGADIVLSPANWWGDAGQLNTWATRVMENDFALVVANRWGSETDSRYGGNYLYDMSDAPSAVIAPGDGDANLLLVHRATRGPAPRDEVLHATVTVARARIGTKPTDSWTISARSPAAYGSIAGPYYRPDLDSTPGGQPAPGLPSPGAVRIATIAYHPGWDPAANAALVEREYARLKISQPQIEVVVLPARAIAINPVDTADPAWGASAGWKELQALVDGGGPEMLATSLVETETTQHKMRETAVVLRSHLPPLLQPMNHAWPPDTGTPAPPLTVDLAHARVGVVLGRDLLIPEMSLALAKAGADIVVVSTESDEGSLVVDQQSAAHWPQSAWRTRANDGLHIAVSSAEGRGFILRDGYGFVDSVAVSEASNGTASQVMEVNSNSVRTKYLNAYLPEDLAVLGVKLGPPTPGEPRALRAPAAGLMALDSNLASPKPAEATVDLRGILPPGLRPPLPAK